MVCWIAQDNWGGVFAYSKEPKFENGIWYGDYLFYVTNGKIPNKVKTFQIPNKVKALLKQQKAVKVEIHVTVTKIEQLTY